MATVNQNTPFDPLSEESLNTDSQFSDFDPNNCKPRGNITDALLNCDGQTVNSVNLQETANEVVDLYGMTIWYYRHEIDLKSIHPVYGDSCAQYSEKPYEMKGYVSITNDVSFMFNGGITNDNDVELQISYDEWNKAVGSNISPQNNDKFEVKSLLCNRPSGFTRAIFKVVNQGDSDLFESSKRWTIGAVRDKHNQLPNEPREEDSTQVMDSEYFGEVDIETAQPIEDVTDINPCPEKSVDSRAKENYHQKKTQVYGGYIGD